MSNVESEDKKSSIEKLVDSQDLLFELQDKVKTLKDKVSDKEKVLLDLETVDQKIRDLETQNESNKKLFAHLIFERIRTKEALLTSAQEEHLKQLISVFEPEEEEGEDSQEETEKA